MQVVNSTFLADIIHQGHLPAALFPRYTELNQRSEFLPENSVEASRMLGVCVCGWVGQVCGSRVIIALSVCVVLVTLIYLELWKPFMKRFTKLHSQFVDSSLVPPQEEAAFPVGRKRSRDESTLQEGPRDKLRFSVELTKFRFCVVVFY